MAVPDTKTFRLSDVTREIANEGGSTDKLEGAFSLAIAENFDSRYSNDKRSLYNFRNYGNGNSEQQFTVVFISAIHEFKEEVVGEVTIKDGPIYSNMETSCGATSTGWDHRETDQGGLVNSNKIINQIGVVGLSENAANLCLNYSHGGYSDWYLGSIEEVGIMINNMDYINTVSIPRGGDEIPFNYKYEYHSSTEAIINVHNSLRYNPESFFITPSYKGGSARARPQKTLILPYTSNYSVGDYAFGGAVFCVLKVGEGIVDVSPTVLSAVGTTHNNACTSYNTSKMTYYISGPISFFEATGLYKSINKIKADPGHYTNGNYSRYWDGENFVGTTTPCT